MENAWCSRQQAGAGRPLVGRCHETISAGSIKGMEAREPPRPSSSSFWEHPSQHHSNHPSFDSLASTHLLAHFIASGVRGTTSVEDALRTGVRVNPQIITNKQSRSDPSPPETSASSHPYLLSLLASTCAFPSPSRQLLSVLRTPPCRSLSLTPLRARAPTLRPTTPPRRPERTTSTARTTRRSARKPASRRSRPSKASFPFCSGYLELLSG